MKREGGDGKEDKVAVRGRIFVRNRKTLLEVVGMRGTLWMFGCLIMACGLTVAVLAADTITVAYREDPGSLDPASSMPSSPTWFLYYQVYERLVKANPNDPNTVQPVLATSWSVSEDGKEWIFNLRKGVTFHDGSPMTAEDVKYSFDRLLAINLGPASWFADIIQEVVVVDEHTVLFRLKRPYGMFLGLLSALDGPYIVCEEAFKAHASPDDPWAREWAKEHMVGTGPYKLVEWVHGQYIILEKYDGYWRGWEGKHFDKIVFKVVREVSSRMMGIIAGTLDYVTDISFTDIPRLQADPNVEVHVTPTTQLWLVHMNNQRPPLTDRNLREVLSWAFPYKKAIEYIFQGYAKQAQGTLARGILYHNPNLPIYHEDLDRAKAIFEGAGYQPGEVTLDLYYVSGVDFERRLAEAFQSNLAQIGINLELKAAPWPTLVALNEQPPEERPYMSIRYNAPDFNDPFSQTLKPLYECGQSWNWSAYCNSEYDELLAEAESTVDPDRLQEIAYKLQEKVVNDVVNIFVAEGSSVVATRKDIKGFYSIPFYPDIVYVYDLYRE